MLDNDNKQVNFLYICIVMHRKIKKLTASLNGIPWMHDSRSLGLFLFYNIMKHHGNRIHGETGKNYIYRLWANIKTRCYNKNNHKYKSYGARGIAMHEPWINNYLLFKSYIVSELGDRPKGYSLDRINNDGNYEPGNIRWADDLTQNHNARPKKLNKEDVLEIRWLISLGYNQKEIALDYNTCQSNISKIKHVTFKNL